METKKITLEDWSEYARKGIDIPITVTLHGSSMEPLIRYMKDPVTIIPLKREPMVGDIVMFHRADGAYVAHRVHQGTPNRIITWGDNCIRPDAPLERGDILGLLVSMERNGKRRELDTDEQRAWGIRWHKRWRKPWLFCRRNLGRVKRCIKLIIPGLNHRNA